MTKHTGIGFTKLNKLNKKIEYKLIEGDIYIKNDFSISPRHILMHINNKYLELVKSPIKSTINYKISLPPFDYQILRYVGPEKEKIINILKILANDVHTKKHIYLKDFKKNIHLNPCLVKMSESLFRKYKDSIESINTPNINYPSYNVNCVEFIIMLWIMALGEVLGVNNINKIMPVTPSKCSWTSLLKLAEKYPIYWKKINYTHRLELNS